VNAVAVRVEVRGGPRAVPGGGGPLTVAAVSGEITSMTAPALRERLAGLLPPGGRLRLDLSQVSYISSAGLRVLVLLHRQARDRASAVELAGLGEQLRFVLSATGFLDLLDIVPDQEAEKADGSPGSGLGTGALDSGGLDSPGLEVA
jgi:anti-sigma B factor antagonist